MYPNTYDIKQLIQFRLDEQPKTHPIPAEQDYWCKLIQKGHDSPRELTIGESFELGRYMGGMFQSDKLSDEFKVYHIVAYVRRLNGILGR